MSTQSALTVGPDRRALVRLILAAGALLGLIGLLAALTPAGDAVMDRGARAAVAFGGFRDVSWVWLPLLVAISASHYGLAAVALRAASGLRLRLPEAVLAQLAAAAANRLTPLGLGGAAVNARYLTRRGLPAAGAVGSVGALQILGPLTDVAVVAGVLLAVPGAVAESLHLVAGIGVSIERLGPALHRYAVPALAVVVGLLALVWLRRQEHVLLPPHRRSVRRAVSGSVNQVGLLVRRPRDLALAAASSASTTLVLAIGFVISTMAAGGVRSVDGAVMIFSTYLVVSAVASAVPLPAAAGSTEAALLGVLLADGVPAVHALPAVLLFRAVTFWAPAPVGLLAAGVLRRRRIL